MSSTRPGGMSETLFPVAEPPSRGRVQILATILAGFRWPDREAFSHLTGPQRKAALEIAEQALTQLAEAPD